MKRILLCVIVISAVIAMCDAVVFSEVKKKVTLFPFNDLSTSRIDLQSTGIVSAELSKNRFLELVPAEVVRQKIFEMEPAFLWGGQTSGQTTTQTSSQTANQTTNQNTTQNTARQTGGILWKIRPRIVEQVSRGLSSDYSIYGDISTVKGNKVVKVHITDGSTNVLKTFNLTAKSGDELPEKLAVLGRDISSFFLGFTAVDRAEEEVRKFHGGFYNLETVVGKVEAISRAYPSSLPLRAILLDLYLRDKSLFNEKITSMASGIIENYNPANGDDTRYLLSLYLDPYDVLAERYEARRNWTASIRVREKALREFAFFADRQKQAAGHAAFMLAQEFDAKKDRKRAAEYYMKALSFLQSGSEEAVKSRERLKAIEGQ
jgi:hypothetical protein